MQEQEDQLVDLQSVSSGSEPDPQPISANMIDNLCETAGHVGACAYVGINVMA